MGDHVGATRRDENHADRNGHWGPDGRRPAVVGDEEDNRGMGGETWNKTPAPEERAGEGRVLVGQKGKGMKKKS